MTSGREGSNRILETHALTLIPRAFQLRPPSVLSWMPVEIPARSRPGWRGSMATAHGIKEGSIVQFRPPLVVLKRDSDLKAVPEATA